MTAGAAAGKVGGSAEPAGAILVVDDSQMKRYVIRSWLRRAGYTVLEAATGAQALATVWTEPVDAVVLDVRLPDVSGFEICERIKNDPRSSALPVIHVSATAVGVTDRAQGLTRGADAYLAEPIEPEELLATVQAVLRYFRARQRAERLAGRLARLANATSAINSRRTLPDLLRVAAAELAAIFATPALVISATPDNLRLGASTEGPEGTVELGRYVIPAGGPDDAVPVGSSVHREPGGPWAPYAGWAGPADLLIATARAKEGRPPVRAVVPSTGLHDDDEHVLNQFCQAVALAVEALRAYELERRTALVLQRSLLPSRLPEVDGIDLAVRYTPASEHVEVGGDFYEVALLDDVLVAAIGDVAGHSLHAATVMAELRHALRAYLAEGHGPAEVLGRLNALMLLFMPNEIATVCVLTDDPATGLVRLANAGHPMPLLVVDGEVQVIADRVPVLGIEVDHVSETSFVLPRGGTLVLVTDGLVERRGTPITDGLAALSRALATVEPGLDDLCDRLLAEFTGGVPADDDIAILAIRRR